MTIALVVERLFSAVSTSNTEDAIQQLVLLERGGSLLLDSLMNEADLPGDFVDKLRDELADALNDDAMDDILPDVINIQLPDKPDDPRLN